MVACWDIFDEMIGIAGNVESEFDGFVGGWEFHTDQQGGKGRIVVVVE
jgi:hypothetical protein